MKTKKTPSSLASYTLFCDDLRQELGGKLTAVGIYQGVMGLPVNELVLPKLVAWTVLQLPKDWPGGQVEVRLFDHDVLLTEAQFDVKDLPQDADPKVLNVPLLATSFTVKVGMALHVEVSAAGLEHRSADLQIVAQPKETKS